MSTHTNVSMSFTKSQQRRTQSKLSDEKNRRQNPFGHKDNSKRIKRDPPSWADRGATEVGGGKMEITNNQKERDTDSSRVLSNTCCQHAAGHRCDR